ncbi:hypothetical protein CXB51_014756 [Gossypium anomalum]|uniref:Myb/SANT-like domain-containing protein n=1 Tax=Gossypium anomalum TaxID=47600 RepID=A0A8J5YZ44_9ROSI|nr:hypothetical protein CXB51_014756 [Gossypium anomalum]
MSGFSQSSVSSQSSRGTKRKWVPKEDAVLVSCMVDLYNTGAFNMDTGFKADYLNELEKMLEKVLPNAMLKAKPNLELRIRTLKRDWSIVYDMLSGKTIAALVGMSIASLLLLKMRYRATGKDAQIAADIIEEINVEDVAATNTHEKRNDFHGSKADVSLDGMDLSATQPQPEPQLARNQAENIRTVGLEIRKSIASEVVIQQKSEMTIQESDLKLYPTLCEVEGLPNANAHFL